MANTNITGILEKMIGKDKDYRYMATSDLLGELNKESFKADQDLESKLTNIVIQQLEDASGDVSGLAVKCLAPLVKKVGGDRAVEMTTKLCDKLLNGKDQHRDTASIALKTIIMEVTVTSLAEKILVSLAPQLINGVTGGKSAEIKCECLDILCDVLHRFGNLITKDHANMLTALLTQLSSTQASVRKKSVSCIASLAPCLSDDLLAKATLEVVQLLKNRSAKSERTRTNIQMIGALSRSVGYRFGPHLGEAVPLLISYCTSASENDEELREYSLQALESFMLRCPRDISPYCEGILDLALEYVSYDPNFTDNIDDDIDDEGEDEEDDDESANEYTDDEDASWKVRRASAKCLSAIIVSRPQMLSKMYQEACPKLIERFREREENVKMDIFNTFIELLRQTGNMTKGQGDTDKSSPRYLLKQEVPKVVKSINRQLRGKSIKTKAGAFSVLKELVVVLPDCLADQFGSLVPGIEKALNDKSSTSNLKIEALAFTRIVMVSHSPTVFHPHVQALSGPILSAIGDRYYKVTADALRVCGELVCVLRPNSEASSLDFKPYIGPIYNAIFARLSNQDQDQEVKECAISCMGLVISTFGDGLRRELKKCLPILVDRMGNEITRLTVVKAFAVIANSPLRIDLSCVLDHVISELTAFLRKANRALRQATLGTLNSLVDTYGGQISSSSYETIVTELSTLISDMDLYMAALALELCCTVLVNRKSIPNVGLAVRSKVLPQALILIKSALLQGQALQALQKLFANLVQCANTSLDTVLDSLISAAKSTDGLAKQALSSIAQCVAVLCLAAGDQKCASTIEMLKGILKDDSATNSAKQHMALLCLGEIGRRKDLSNHARIENIVIESFHSPFEEIKSAASYALGNIAVGNLSKYLPFILDQIDNQHKKQYLLLHSLKEVIVRQSVDHTGQSELQDLNIVKILALLFNHCESEEEGVRNVVAECLGKIALIEPKKLIPALKERTSSPVANTRATVATAIKYSVVERPGKIDEILYPEISTFLMLIKDSDRHVRRAAILALSTAAHNKPSLIKALLSDLLPLLYDQTVVKEELIRTIDLGPFKHVVDDGLELRKAAFECVDTLLDSCLDQLNPSSFIVPFLISGLCDHYDVKMPCHLILSKIADKCPSAVLAVLDSLVEPLEKTIIHKPKGDAVKQEIDRNEDMIRCALRVIAALSRISGSDYSMKLKNLMNKITTTPSLAEKYKSASALPQSLPTAAGSIPAAAGEMSFFFRAASRPRQPQQELVRSIKDSLLALDTKTGAKALEDVEKNIFTLKQTLSGDGEVEPNQEQVLQIALEICKEGVLSLFVQNLPSLGWEGRKDLVHCWCILLRQKVDESYCCVQYIENHVDLLDFLVVCYNNLEVALNCGNMLRECIKYPALAKYILESNSFELFFQYVELPNFDIASDALNTFKDLLTKHEDAVSEFLISHYEQFFELYKRLLTSDNYVTRRQSVKFLSEFLLEAPNAQIMKRYILEVRYLNIMIGLLKDSSKNIRICSFHIFKVFVANPNKPRDIIEVLVDNHRELLKLLHDLPASKGDDEQFDEERDLIIEEIKKLVRSSV